MRKPFNVASADIAANISRSASEAKALRSAPPAGKSTLRIDTLQDEILISQISLSPYQHRIRSNELLSERLEGLSQSVKSTGGIIQPITVRIINPDPADPFSGSGFIRYELIAGEQRIMSLLDKGESRIPALIFQNLSDFEAAAMTLAENTSRINPPDIEIALGISQLELLNPAITVDEIAERIGIPSKSIYKIKRFLDFPKNMLEVLMTCPRLLNYNNAEALAGAMKGLDSTALESISNHLIKLIEKLDGDYHRKGATITDGLLRFIRSLTNTEPTSKSASIAPVSAHSGNQKLKMKFLPKSDTKVQISIDTSFPIESLLTPENQQRIADFLLTLNND